MAYDVNRTFRFHYEKSVSASKYNTLDKITGHKCYLASYDVSLPKPKPNTYDTKLIDGVIDLDADDEVKYENRILTMTYAFKDGYELREEIMEKLLEELHGKTFWISKSWHSGKFTTWFYHGRVFVDYVRSKGEEGMFCLKCDIEPRMVPVSDYTNAVTKNEISVSGSAYITIDKDVAGISEGGTYRFYIKNSSGDVTAHLKIDGTEKSNYVTDSFNTAKDITISGTEKIEINPNGATGTLTWRRYYYPKF